MNNYGEGDFMDDIVGNFERLREAMTNVWIMPLKIIEIVFVVFVVFVVYKFIKNKYASDDDNDDNDDNELF